MCVCLVVCLSIFSLRKENEKVTATSRQYMFLICPLRVKESIIMDAGDVSVTNVCTFFAVCAHLRVHFCEKPILLKMLLISPQTGDR